ncbi:MAG: methyltransferase domain-containing protein [Deltaproteobacteria bacterium]|nr:methyltransferase domain-containing protein [Deltaproteobacteria bacterium]
MNIDKNKIKKNFSNSHQYDSAISYHKITLEIITSDILDFILKYYADNANSGYVKKLNILDAGCGTGNGLLYIKNKINKNYAGDFNFLYLGIDLALGALKRGKLKFKTNGISNAHLCCSDCEDMPIKNKTINIVFSNMVLHWLNKPIGFVKSVKNSLNLNNDNLFICSFLSEGTLKELNLCYDEYLSNDNTHSIMLHKFPDANHIKNLLVSQGFIIEEFKIIEYKEYAETALELLKKINIIGAKNSINNTAGVNSLNHLISRTDNTDNDNKFNENYEIKINKNYDNKNNNKSLCSSKHSRYLILKKVLKDYENKYTNIEKNVFASYNLAYIKAKINKH